VLCIYRFCPQHFWCNLVQCIVLFFVALLCIITCIIFNSIFNAMMHSSNERIKKLAAMAQQMREIQYTL
jgi:hypothetical protein